MNHRKFRTGMLLALVVGCILLAVGSAFAFSQGYLTRFIVNDVEISRDEFVALADAAAAGQPAAALHCAQMNFSLSTGFVTHCFDSVEKVHAFLNSQ